MELLLFGNLSTSLLFVCLTDTARRAEGFHLVSYICCFRLISENHIIFLWKSYRTWKHRILGNLLRVFLSFGLWPQSSFDFLINTCLFYAIRRLHYDHCCRQNFYWRLQVREVPIMVMAHLFSSTYTITSGPCVWQCDMPVKWRKKKIFS